MSYILDALRRADAERQRGAVPGLHAQALAGVPSAGAAAAGAPARRLALAAAALVLLGLAVAAGWWLRPGAAPGAAQVVLPAPAAPSDLAPSAAAALPGLSTPPQLVALSPVPAQAVAPGTNPLAPLPLPRGLPPAQPGITVPSPAARLPQPQPQPLPTALAVQPAASARRTANAAPSATPAAETATAPAPAQPAPVAAPARLPSLAELPEAQKRELGPLVVGGAMHAEQAALRIVILNGQVFHEGDKLSAELQVQQIRLKSVVMSHRGQRFELPF